MKRLLLLSVTLGMIPGVAMAQEMPDVAPTESGADDSQTAEIIVTARKRDEALVDVPVSITVVTAETLNKLQYRTAGEFLTLSPGVSVDTSSANGLNTNITIRGVGTADNFVEPGNAVYIDEVYASGTRTLLPAFYDIQSVQVLKGPQAGLYGRNTTGGAVIITTGQPTDRFELAAQASYASLDRLDVNGTVNLPLADFVQVRATGWYLDQGGGYYRNRIVGVNRDAFRDTGGRLNIALIPSADVRLVVSGEYSDQQLSGFEGIVDGARFGPGPTDIESRLNELRDDAGGIGARVYRVQAKLDVATGFGDLVLVGGRRRLDIDEPGSDFDGTAFSASVAAFAANPAGYVFGQPRVPGFISALVLTPFVNSRDETSQSNYLEGRFSSPQEWDRVKLLGGVSYYDDRSTFDDNYTPVRQSATLLPLIDAAPFPLPDLNGAFNRAIVQKTTSWAGFGQAIVKLGEQIEVTAELRYTRDEKDIRFAQNASGLFGLFLPSATVNTVRTFDNWSPGVTIAFRPSSNVNLYAKYVEGFRAGGFNTLVNDPANVPYDPEQAENYEVGLKGQDFGGRFNYGISAFYHRISNTLVPVVDPGQLFDAFPLRNAGNSTTFGLEANARLALANGLTLTGSFGMFSTKLKSDTVTLAVEQRPFVPSATGSLVLSYERPLSSAITGLFTLGYRHRSGGFISTDERIPYDMFNLVDANVGIRINDRFEIQAFAKNLLDDHFVTSNKDLTIQQEVFNAAAGGDPDANLIRRDPGAQYGVRASVRF